MHVLRYIFPVVTAFIVYKVSWFTLTDFEGNSIDLTLNGATDGGELWVPENFGDIGGFPFGYVIVAVLAIGLFVMGRNHGDEEDANFTLAGTGVVTLVLTVVTLFMKNTIIGASPEEMQIDGYPAMDFSLAPAFWIVLVLSIAMIAAGIIALVMQYSAEQEDADREPETEAA